MALSRIQEWTDEVMRFTGPDHWSTCSAASAHITGRILGPRRSATPDAALVHRYAAGITRAADGKSLAFKAMRILITPISVMLGLEPTGDQPSRLAKALGDALGSDGWFERDRVRDIWYVNLVHFSGPVASPPDLVDWVERFALPTSFTVRGRSLDVVRWQFDGIRMMPATLTSVPLC
jgi:hypothetical protein